MKRRIASGRDGGFCVLALHLVLALGCVSAGSAETAADEPGPLRVLFLGNSLTYANDLPEIVVAMSRHGERPIAVEMFAKPNWGLEDHWRNREVRRLVGQGTWDVVVMQQGPSSLMSSRKELVKWSGKLADEVRGAGGRPALFTVWPSRSRLSYLGAVIESYAVAAEACDCLRLPGGAGWLEAWTRDPSLGLFGPDGFHPSVEGSYLASLIIWAGLTGEDPAKIPADLEDASGTSVRIDVEQAALYREVAAQVLGGF